MHQIALDTNIAIDILNGDEGTIRVLSPYEEIYLPFTVCGELLFGAMNSKKSIQNVKKFKAIVLFSILTRWSQRNMQRFD